MDAPHGRAVGRAGVRRESSEAALVVVMGDETAPPPLPLAAAVVQRTTSAPPPATAPRHRQRCRIEIEMTEKHRPDCVHGTLKKEQLHCHHPTAAVGTNGSVVIKERIDIDYCDDSGDDHRRRSDDWEGAAARPEAGAGAAAPGPGVAVRPSRKGLRLNDEGSFHQPPQEDRAEVERAPLLGRPTDETAPASANIWEKSEPALLMAATTGQPIIISANTEQPLIISTPAVQPVIISCVHDKSPCHKAPPRNHAPGPSTCPIESKDPPPIEQSPPTKNEQNANDPPKDFVWETPKPLVLNVSNSKLRVSFARNLEEESAAKPAVNDGQKGEPGEDRRSVLKRSSHDLSTGAASPSDYLSATLGRGQSIPSAGTVAAASSSAAPSRPPAQPPPPPPPNSVVSAAPAKASTHQSNTYPSSRVQYYYAMSQNSHDSIFSKEAQDASFPAGLQPTRLLTTTADARGAESTASAGMDIIRQITAYTVEPPRVILQQPARAPLLRDDTPLGKAVASKLSAPVTISAVGAEDDSTETSVELGSTSLGASASPPLSPDSASVAADADASQHIRAQARAAFAEAAAGRAGIERAPGGYLDPVPGWRTYPEARTNYFGAGAPGAVLSSSESDWERERGHTLFLRRAPLRANVTAEGRAARRSRDPTLGLTPSLERDPSPATTAAVSAASGLSVEQAALKLRMQDPCWVTAPMVRAALERRRAEKAAAEGAWRRREARAERQRERQAEAERARAERHLLLEQARQRAEDRDLERARRKQATWIKLKSDPCWDEPPVQFKVPSTGGMREGAAAAAPDDSSLAVTLPPDDTTTTSEESSVVSSGDRPVVRRVPHANLSRTNVVAFVPAKLTATPFSVAAAEGRALSLLQPSSSQSAAYAPDALQPLRAYTHVVVVQDNPPSEAAEAVGGRASKAKLAAAAAVAAVAATATQAAGAAEAGAKALADAVRGHSADASPHRLPAQTKVPAVPSGTCKYVCEWALLNQAVSPSIKKKCATIMRALTTMALSEAPPAPPTPAPAPEPAARGEGPQPSSSHAEKARAAAKPSKALRREQRARKLESERGGVRETSSDEMGAPGGEATSQPAAGAARHIWPAATSSSVVFGAAVHVRRDATRPHAEAPPPPPPLKAQPSPVLAPPPPPPLAPPLAPPPPPTALPQSLRRPQSPPAKPGAPAAATDSIIVVELKPAQVDLVSAASPAEKAEPETDVQKKKKKKKRKEQKKHERERRERGGALRRIWRFLTCRS